MADFIVDGIHLDASFLKVALRAKGIVAAELRGFASGMRRLARRPQLRAGLRAIDIVGTGGDGSADGRRTRSTPLPAAMVAVEPESVGLAYRDRMVQVARKFLPGRVGIHRDGFAGRWDA